jgi:beta-aspartyl-peptidase (threonine type)
MMRSVAAFATAAIALVAQAADAPFAIAIHGGAGAITRVALSTERERESRAVLTEALVAGQRILERGGSALDAVTAAVKVMEDSPLFNAGRGSVFTAEGTNEMDAAVMDGRDRRAGAVAGVTVVKNPIAAARAVMEKSGHVLLAGRGAEQFAREQGLEIVDPSYFRTEERWRQLELAKERRRTPLDHDAPARPGASAPGEKLGTVGAVALDKAGNLAAATSTGGITNKRFGRIGDSPIPGAGTWAENETVAVSATGTGEMFLRGATAHDVAALVRYKGLAPKQAADAALAKVRAIGGRGGLVVLDRSGIPVFSFTTEGMYRGYATGTAAPEVMIFR